MTDEAKLAIAESQRATYGPSILACLVRNVEVAAAISKMQLETFRRGCMTLQEIDEYRQQCDPPTIVRPE